MDPFTLLAIGAFTLLGHATAFKEEERQVAYANGDIDTTADRQLMTVRSPWNTVWSIYTNAEGTYFEFRRDDADRPESTKSFLMWQDARSHVSYCTDRDWTIVSSDSEAITELPSIPRWNKRGKY